MRHTSRVVVTIAIAIAIIGASHSQSTQLQSSKPAFSLSISTPSTTVSKELEVRITIVLTNTSDHELVVPRTKGTMQAERDYTIDVKDANGRSPLTTEYYRAVKHKEQPGDTMIVTESYGSFSVEPGHSLQEQAIVNKLFKLDPGTYIIQAERKDWESGATVQSNPLRLTITGTNP